MVDKQALLKLLNKALSQEHACNIRYSTHATVVSGPYADTIEDRLKEIADDERKHAQILRDQIDYLGGDPTMDVAKEDLRYAKELNDILAINIDEEEKAIGMYRGILKMVDELEMTWLHEAIEEIIEDEEEHLYELRTLRGR